MSTIWLLVIIKTDFRNFLRDQMETKSPFGPHFCCWRSPFGLHFTQNEVPIWSPFWKFRSPFHVGAVQILYQIYLRSCTGYIEINQGSLVLLLDLAQRQVGCENCSQIRRCRFAYWAKIRISRLCDFEKCFLTTVVSHFPIRLVVHHKQWKCLKYIFRAGSSTKKLKPSPGWLGWWQQCGVVCTPRCYASSGPFSFTSDLSI